MGGSKETVRGEKNLDPDCPGFSSRFSLVTSLERCTCTPHRKSRSSTKNLKLHLLFFVSCRILRRSPLDVSPRLSSPRLPLQPPPHSRIVNRTSRCVSRSPPPSYCSPYRSKWPMQRRVRIRTIQQVKPLILAHFPSTDRFLPYRIGVARNSANRQLDAQGLSCSKFSVVGRR